MSRDWTQTLWSASFKGVPFWVDKDTEKGGRRLALHEFYGRDDPFIEDLGQKAKPYSITAYLVGDTSDGDASALSATFDAKGSGTLVLPTHGPIANCYCEDFDRSRSKDKLGLIAYEAKFWRDGTSVQSVTAPYLAQLAYDAIAALAGIVQGLAAGLVTSGPAYIAGDVVSGFEDNIAALEAIRSEAAIPASQAAALTSQLSALYASVPDRISQETGADVTLASDTLTAAQALATAMPAASAARLFAEAYDAAAPAASQLQNASGALLAQVSAAAAAGSSVLVQAAASTVLTQNAAIDAANAGQILRLQRLAMMAGYVQGVIATAYVSRPDGVNARTALVARFDLELGQCQGAADMALYLGLEKLRSTAIAFLQQIIVTLAPVLTVRAPRSLPSLWWAWRLYQDPSRAAEIVARNNVPHPSFCPEQLEVLAPSAISSSAV